jgi:hypothetical protein
VVGRWLCRITDANVNKHDNSEYKYHHHINVWIHWASPSPSELLPPGCYFGDEFKYQKGRLHRHSHYNSWLRHYATSRKVPGSIPDVIGFFNWPNPSSPTMALGQTQPLTEMSTRNILGVEGGWHVGLTTSPPSVSRLSRTVVLNLGYTKTS